jgi:NTE family protein
MNARGGEARLLLQIGGEPGLLAEVYQPIDVRGHWFVGGRAGYSSPLFSQFNADGDQVARYEVPTTEIDLYGGREFGNYGGALLGWRRANGEARVVTGATALPEEEFESGEVRWSLTYDRLDSAYLPRDGAYVNLVGVYSRKEFGADTEFDQINLDMSYARLFGSHSGFVGLRYHATTSGEAPFQSQYRLGGVTRFAGYHPNQLVTPNYALGYGGYTFELGEVLNRPTILGGTVEYGETWGNAPGIDRKGEWHGSLYLGFDSWLGRFMFGYGRGQNGDGTFFLELGQKR